VSYELEIGNKGAENQHLTAENKIIMTVPKLIKYTIRF
jgi:hypothetical protein